MPDPIEIPPLVRPPLEWWMGEVRGCLSDRIHAVLIHGSVALGDFCPGWSDVDFCVGVNGSISESDGEALGEIHDRLEDRYLCRRADGWRSGQILEGCYVPRELMVEPEAELPSFTAGGGTRRWVVEQPIAPFDRYVLAHSGLVLAGEPVSAAPSGRSALAAQTRRELAEVRRHASGSPSSIWLCAIQHWLARSLVFWRDGEMLSKSAALRREIERDSPSAEAFRMALVIRDAGSSAAAGHHAELEHHFAESGLPCSAEIGDLVETTRGED